jgi:trans-aconitate methyltransferase
MTHTHHHHSAHEHSHAAHADVGHQRGLDLDAEVFGDQLSQALDRAEMPTVTSIVDLGAGTGVGSRLLRHRYPDAAITCVDNDENMLARLADQGFTTVHADLDDGFPVLDDRAGGSSAGRDGVPAVDLVWASSSLHHVAQPARLLSEVRRALAPHGALVVVELATLPCFLRSPDEALLEQRCQAAAAAEGWNRYPDWQPVIQDAGFSVTRSDISSVAPVTPAAREYAHQWLARYLRLATLTPGDRTDLQALLERPARDLALAPRAARTAWVATPDRLRDRDRG